MEELLKLIKAFEARNNLSVYLELHGDGSSSVIEFWEEKVLEHFKTLEELYKFLKETRYELDERGICKSPVKKIN